MPGRRVVYMIACGVLGAAAACDSFGGGGSTPAAITPDSGGIDDASSNVQDGSIDDGDQPDSFAPPPPPDDILDASVRPDPSVAQSDGLYLTCPPTSTGSKFTNLNPTTVVQHRPGFDFPFGIVTDSLYVYWVSQFTDQADATVEQYNGHAKARIHRASKTSVNADPGQTILVDGEAEGTVALALDGDFIYWGSVKDASTVQLRRVRRTCAAATITPCTPENFVELPANRPISHIRRARPGLLFAMTDQGKLFSIDTSTKSVSAGEQQVDSNPGLAATGESAFVSWLDQPYVFKFGATGFVKHGEYLPGDAAPIGSNQIATDCTRLFALRKQDGDVWVANAKQPSSFEKYATAGQLAVYDAFADNDYVYLASANGQGLRVIDIATHASIQKFNGSYFRIWADNTGLYAGDHSQDNAGAIYRFGN